MPATARMPATVWMQATAVTQATTVTPASSNSKDDSNHDRSQQQERKQQQEWQQEQDRQNSMDDIKIGGIAVSRHVAGAAGDAKCPRRPCYCIPRKEIHKWDFRCSVISRKFCERHSNLQIIQALFLTHWHCILPFPCTDTETESMDVRILRQHLQVMLIPLHFYDELIYNLNPKIINQSFSSLSFLCCCHY